MTELEVRAEQLPADLSEVGWDQLVEFGRQAVKVESVSCWLMGDLAVEVSEKARHGDGALDRFAEEVDVSVGTLRNYRVVSEAYPRGSALRSAASFGVLRVFKDLADREDLLSAKAWTYREALDEVDRRKKQAVASQRQLEEADRKTKSEDAKRRQREKEQQRALEYDKAEEPANDGTSLVDQLLGGPPAPNQPVVDTPDPPSGVKTGVVLSPPTLDLGGPAREQLGRFQSSVDLLQFLKSFPAGQKLVSDMNVTQKGYRSAIHEAGLQFEGIANLLDQAKRAGANLALETFLSDVTQCVDTGVRALEAVPK